jgi:Transposase IS66 family
VDQEQSQPPVSKGELEKATAWFDANRASLPDEVAGILARIFAVYMSFSQSAKRAKATLEALRRAMGFLPKSERGKSDSIPTPEPFPQIDANPEAQAAYGALNKKRAELNEKRSAYHAALKNIRQYEISPQLELPLASSFEMQFSYPFAERKELQGKEVVDRMQEFGREKGFHVSNDDVKRVNLQVIVSDINYTVETVTDLKTGKSVRASMDHIGPEGFQYTWTAIGNLIKMNIGFAIPINRIGLMIGQPEFTSTSVCRALDFVAEFLLQAYLVLAEQLADAWFIAGDDTSTKIIELQAHADEMSISRQLDERLGWQSMRADGNGEKKTLNVSLLIGRTAEDPRSTIRFFRTHVGSVGNLLDKILETRSPKNKDLYLLGDLSSCNLPRNEEIKKLFNIFHAGCGSHARRPFWRYREEDPSLCYYMLKGFLRLAEVEKRIDAKGRTRANVLKYRGRFARGLWLAMKNRCQAAITGEVPSFATYPQGITPDIWPPDTELYAACRYVIKNFDELTLYLTVPELPWTNNGTERGLRAEKSLLDTAKFSKTRNGRARTDILRTINATCVAAGLDVATYLAYVYKHRAEYNRNPERFTPFEVARRLELENRPQSSS